MPNLANVASPINIHGIGRSGTTLLQNLLAHFNYIQVCNETLGLVFHAHRGGDLLVGSHDKEALGLPRDGRVAARSVQAAMCTLLASSKHLWSQKLGGIPNTVVWESLVTAEDRSYASQPYPFPYAWYWRVLRQSFPFSVDLLTLRNWRDVVVSRMIYSDYQPADYLRDLAVYLNLMAHPDSQIDLAYRLENLSANPETVMVLICNVLGIAYEPGCLLAMDWYAVGGRSDLQAARNAGFSWRSRYDALGAEFDATAQIIMRPAVEKIKERFGTDLDASV